MIKYNEMPSMRPVPIATKDKGFIGAILMWLLATRQWTIAEDWKYEIDGTKYVIPAGFTFDGASIPKFFWKYLSPTGVLLMPGLVHDWIYKTQSLKRVDGNDSLTFTLDQKQCDEIFRDLAIEINGFKVINNIAYYILRVFGRFAWNAHRKND
jgi:hypothetical protein|tara:strand:- start:1087 stop:1545 length:459 start_codon:yes stop_codon:yes gene_type:complete